MSSQASKGTVLIIDGGCEFEMSKGNLNHYLAEVAKNQLESFGWNVITTAVDKGYDIKEEVDKIVKCDVAILQVPGWWMGLPWKVKQYIDTVFQSGRGVLFNSDGRTRKDPSKKYGTGGCLSGKRFMVSSTWNAPEIAFTEEGQFYADLGKKKHWATVEKAFRFIGFDVLEGMYFFDVHKDPHVEQEVEQYKQLLEKYFK
ncbi:Flavodoxin-like fold family protein [Trichomonas vaginalis G3]|uniref:Flavodoxin-like fold family protein n=1 Tax=Trichomonas vaginalis (strain ATCC PRA-98 / G3) TaxID=412133 RepID=A2DV20_TRIV3|nr:flavodoxin-like fold [Trichomonas vaginalis G3]EAY15747.1 Flavodoxin-like fold family protein [Trichomonas vaginalis G3]KAI5486522.1 flavodoxin-like fold [Trichomonas vaginalis G3]|eukprot:XP_001327970.1 Flavodoxin-like fold family protein [Trichomonas vaginalis G3]